MYGIELVMDLYDCAISKFNREDLTVFFNELCKAVDMTPEDLHFWDWQGVPEDEIPYDKPHLIGTSAVQFITTSNIVVHTLDLPKECYVNLFTCKNFKVVDGIRFISDFFGCRKYEYTTLKRGRLSGCNNVPDSNCVSCVSHGRCSGAKWTEQLCQSFEEDSSWKR